MIFLRKQVKNKVSNKEEIFQNKEDIIRNELHSFVVRRLYYHKLYCSISDEWYIALCYKGYIQVFFNTSLEKKAIHILQYSVNVSEMYPNTVLIIRTWKCKIYTFKIHIIACIGKYIKLTWNSKMHCRIFII